MTRKNNWLLTAVQTGLLVWSGAALAADKVYVANEGADTVSVLDATSFESLATVRVGRMPHNVQVSPDGKFVWVTNNGEPGPTAGASAHQGMAHGAHEAMAQPGAVWLIDTSTHAVVAQVPVGMHPAHVVVSPDGRMAYVTNGGDDTVSVVDTSARRTVATIAVGQFPHGLRVSPNGQEIYVANLKGGTVSVIDTASQKAVAQIAVGKGPAQTGFTPDGRLAFVSLSQENAVAVIDTVTRQVIRKVAVGTVPIQLYATPDSRTLLVANQGTRSKPGKAVSLIDLQSFKVVKTILTGAGAHGVVVDRDGRFAYVTNTYAQSVAVLDLKDLRLTKTVPVGKAPNGISITP
ncbi:cytochrome D1 domain-containing protein [Hydrogenophaga sp. MI9]|uniref:YVTN family beta-propeller repeat protein n=1 Tax=Hydrogenophaga sp. MI9 TaxID=3453719 RepID=UPI003EE9542C